VTIRTALGATRAALTRRAGLEVLVLAIGGCGAGILVAQPALQLLIRLAPPEIPRLDDVRLNVDVILFSFLISLLTMAATALLPLWRSWQVDPASAMKQDAARGTESRSSGRLRQALIVGEVALTLMLSVGAVLLVRQLMAQARVDLGFSPDGLVMLDTHKIGAIAQLRQEQFFGPHADPAAVQAAGQHDMHDLETVLDGVRSVPGVESVAAAAGAPTTAMIPDVDYAVRGVSEFKPGAERLPNANILGVTPNYLATMQIPVLRGRGIADADRAGTEKVVVISESMARQSFAGKDPIGRQITCGWDSNGEWWTIVGVVGDVRQDSPASAPYPTIYAPVAQHPHASNDMQLMVRTQKDGGAMTAALMRYLHTQFPQVAVKGATMRENLGESQRAQRFRTLLFASFAGVSILLAITGMYGVTAYTVAERRFEFALRFALGAQRAQVLSSVLKGALTVAAVGVVGGVALSLAFMRVIGSLLGEMPAFDLVSYGVASGGVLLIAIAATLQPAYRAAMVEPMRVLRDE
jgi:putative ABC transport system permease protein